MLYPENWQEYRYAADYSDNTGGSSSFLTVLDWRIWRVTARAAANPGTITIGSVNYPAFGVSGPIGVAANTTLILEPKGMAPCILTWTGLAVTVERIQRTPSI
jgi:hypothetical protein